MQPVTGADPYRALATGLPNGAVALFDAALLHRLFDGAEAHMISAGPGTHCGSGPGTIYPATVAGEIERRYRETIGGRPQSFDISLGESEYRVVTAPLALDGAPHGIALFQNVTSEKREQEQVWRKANFDDVTGLPNRRLTTDRLAVTISSGHCCSSTWTTSRASTTCTATMPATRCCVKSPNGSAVRSEGPTRSAGSPATSS